MKQEKQEEWKGQWEEFHEALEIDCLSILLGQIHPLTLQVAKDKDVLDSGCGSGEHLNCFLPYVKSITGVDLNPSEYLMKRFCGNEKVKIIQDDIAHMDLGRQFDLVYSIGCTHHTVDPGKTIENLKKHVKPGGRLIVWVYSREGNWINLKLIEPLKKFCFKKMSWENLKRLSYFSTFIIYILAFTLYQLPFRFLPFYEYICRFRRLRFKMNFLNIFDKLNAPLTHFISRKEMEMYFKNMEQVSFSYHLGIAWSFSGIKPNAKI